MAVSQSFRNLCSLLKSQNARFPIVTRKYQRWVAPTLKEIKRRKDKLGPQPPTKRSSFLEWNHDAEIFAFGKRLNENFDNNLLKAAFTHRSYILQEELRQREAGIENPVIELLDNRELKQDGEKLISEIVSKWLSEKLPKLPDDGIDALHDYLLSDSVLADVSFHLGTKDIILSCDFPAEQSTLADTIKSIIGALKKSSGEERAELFVNDFIMTQLNGKDINEIWVIKDPMKMLSDVLLEQKRGPPEPRLVNEAGRNTILAVYQVGIYSDKKLLSIGSGESESIAVETAALESLRTLFGIGDNMAPFKFKSRMNTKRSNEKLQISN